MTATVENPSVVPAENNDLPIPTKNGGVPMSRAEANAHYAQRAMDAVDTANRLSDPQNFPLTNIQFHAMVDFLELDGPVRSVIAAMPKGMARSMALKRYENSASYDRNDPLVAAIAASDAVSLSDADLDAAWMEAKEL